MSQEQAKQFVDQATQSLQSGQFDQALELIDQAIALDPNSSDSFVLRGIALSQTAQPQAATESFRKAIMLSPYNAKAYFNLSVHQYAQGNKVEALEMARETAKIDPRHAGARDMMTKIEAELSGDVTPGQVPSTPTNPADPLSAPPVGAPPVAGAQSGGMVREGLPPSAAPIGPNAPGPAANPYLTPPQGHYVRPGYEQPVHSLPFVEGLGGTWTGIGWALVLAQLSLFVVTLFTVLPKMAEIMSNPTAARQVQGSPGLTILAWLLIAAILFWEILDIVDRRGNWAWLIAFIPCCFFSWIVLPIYMLAGRK